MITRSLAQHDAAEPDHLLAAHRVADHRESFLPHLVVRRDVIGRVEIALVDFGVRHELVDLDRVVALDRDRVELLVLDLDEGALGVFVAAALVGGVHRLARHLVDELLAQPVAGDLVDLAERDALRTARRAVQRDRARDERELEIALPVGTRRHGILLRNRRKSGSAEAENDRRPSRGRTVTPVNAESRKGGSVPPAGKGRVKILRTKGKLSCGAARLSRML